MPQAARPCAADHQEILTGCPFTVPLRTRQARGNGTASAPVQLFFSSFDMMSVAFRVTLQAGKSLVVKKLSVRSGK
jgi:hypothetical protein